MRNEIAEVTGGKELVPGREGLDRGFAEAYRLVDDIVLKNYLNRLQELEIVPLERQLLEHNISDNVRMFKINEMVYERDENAIYKFAGVFNAVAASDSTIFTIMDSDGEKTDFYMGIRSMDPEASTKTSYETLLNAIKGQFPGIKTENCLESRINEILRNVPSASISSVTCVANNKTRDIKENAGFLQGLEKLALAMQGKRYTAVIIANSTSQEQLNEVRRAYENIYTQLCPFASFQAGYGVNTGVSGTHTETSGTTYSYSDGTNSSAGHSQGSSTSHSHGNSRQSKLGKVGSTLGGTLSMAGAVIGSIVPGVGTVIGAAGGMAIGSILGSAVANFTNKTLNESSTDAGSTTDTLQEGSSHSDTHGNSGSTSDSRSDTSGETKNLQLNIQNKSLTGTLERIDRQLKRLDEFESVGMWECSAYFLSDMPSVAQVASATYKALMSGENTGVEISAINTWNRTEDKGKNGQIREYVTNFMHPVFTYRMQELEIPVKPAALVSGNELAIHMGLPRKSVCGLPVIDHAGFGKEVVKYGNTGQEDLLSLGRVYNMGSDCANSVRLAVNDLAMHTFVTGSTGSGKSNVIYGILDQLLRKDIHFMVVEPAKGEYKRVFGIRKNVCVFGTNPEYSEMLKINPFRFPPGIHVLEHIDRLIEIFNVCWPMYAAMPAVLKDAVLHAYKTCGWDLTASRNTKLEGLYPTFRDLLIQLKRVIDNSAYSEEMKGNYTGSLITRVSSLTNGLNGMIFSSGEIDNRILFDANVIVDLSRVGSSETKSLIMGILIMRLSEYRMSGTEGMNLPLRHVTVLEEAHNILRKTAQTPAGEGENVAGKSVEMISNSMAEMRTYGEGFLIADQAPGELDSSAIRNTNTKIIMRLPDEEDRRLAGRAAALKKEQLDEIAKLPTGVAAVYQNDWIEPVLCHVDRFTAFQKDYHYIPGELEKESAVKADILKFLVNRCLGREGSGSPKDLYRRILGSDLDTGTKLEVIDILQGGKDVDEELLDDLLCNVYEAGNAFEAARRAKNMEEWNSLLIENIAPQLKREDPCYRSALISSILCSKAKDDIYFEEMRSKWKQYMSTTSRKGRI